MCFLCLCSKYPHKWDRVCEHREPRRRRESLLWAHLVSTPCLYLIYSYMGSFSHPFVSAITSKETPSSWISNEMLTSCHMLDVFLSACSVARSDGVFFTFSVRNWQCRSSGQCVRSWIQFHLCLFAVLLSFWCYFTSSFCMLVCVCVCTRCF